ncbi:phospho-sugar mutase [Tomitella biformata]|uniref:phospho-sugar mutase n=1 Tax=Tomitella biformata TaxID=630403 RepID=UPI001F2CA796|nr:phospho-sugar mutase [Tomitella biformata]
MNLATVVRATAGLAAYLATVESTGPGTTVVVGRDARHGSAEFARAAAEVLAGAGHHVVLLPRPLPTPVVAFAVLRLKAAAGVQITASHNPAGDNGYKVYLGDGAQLISPADRLIENAIGRVGPANEVPRAPVAPAGDELVEAYLDAVCGLVDPGPDELGKPLRIAVTAMHGVGGQTLLDALHRVGHRDIHVVASQFAPDPDFPTAPFPNPEEPGACDRLLALAAEVDADIAIALDPDADRCAVGVADNGVWRMLRGDEVGAILGEHLLARSAPGGLVASTLVSSQLLGKIAAARGARHAQTLTGFKWLVRAGAGLVYAYEEAIGYCVAPEIVRDKDGISAALVVCELAGALKARGRTLDDVLADLAAEFGAHVGTQVSVRVERLALIAQTMARLRHRPPTELAGIEVACADLLTHPTRTTDALVWTGASADGLSVRVVIRPSGTEPKLKAYLEAVAEDTALAQDLLERMAEQIRRLL